MITRFEFDGCDMEPQENGGYVLYEDHLREIEIMQSRIDFWRNACKELGSHL